MGKIKSRVDHMQEEFAKQAGHVWCPNCRTNTGQPNAWRKRHMGATCTFCHETLSVTRRRAEEFHQAMRMHGYADE